MTKGDPTRSSASLYHARMPTKNIIVIGAHPDDCEFIAGGAAVLWSRRGDRVKFVSATNGDVGHWNMAGGPLAQRRLAEVRKAAEILGIAETAVLDNHDGEMQPTLENRKTIVRLIRSWNADVVITHRPFDYHPDHRYTSMCVQDAAYMVTVPFYCPDTPALKTNPVFLYANGIDYFQRPVPFRGDVVVRTDEVREQKIAALQAMESQFFEGGCGTPFEPRDEKDRAERHRQTRGWFESWFVRCANTYRTRLIELYGKPAGEAAQHAEAYEVCEYGRQPDAQALAEIFPFDGLRL